MWKETDHGMLDISVDTGLLRVDTDLDTVVHSAFYGYENVEQTALRRSHGG